MIVKQKKYFFSFLYLFFVCFLVYFVQDFMTNKNTTGLKHLDRGGVHLSIFIVLIVLSLHFFHTIFEVKILKKNRNKITNTPIEKTLWIITLWILFVNILQNENIWTMQIHLGLSILWIMSFSLYNHYLRRNPESWSHIKKFIFIMFIFNFLSALYGSFTISAIYDRVAVINLAYSVIVFLPWISLLKKKFNRVIGYSIVLFVVLISMKRGAILVFPLMIASSFFVEAIMQRKKMQSFFKIGLVTVLFFFGLLFVDQYSGGYLSERFSSDELASGSGRDVIYTAAIADITQRSPWFFLLGRGSGASEKILGTSAHSEWLEFLFSFGFIGALLYALLIFIISQRAWQLVKIKSDYAPGYIMSLVYIFVVGLFGQIYFAHSTIYLMLFFGAVEGLLIKNKRKAQVGCDEFFQRCSFARGFQ